MGLPWDGYGRGSKCFSVIDTRQFLFFLSFYTLCFVAHNF